MSRYRRYLPLVLIALVLMAAAYAFAAANTVDASAAGDGSGDVSGYNVTDIHYELDTATNPANITSVQFTLVNLDPAADPAATVSIQLDGATWISCNPGSGTSWTCPVTGVAAADVTQLRVVAAQ